MVGLADTHFGLGEFDIAPRSVRQALEVARLCGYRILEANASAIGEALQSPAHVAR